MLPDYCTIVVGNQERVVALKFSSGDALIIGGIITSLPFIRNKTISLAVFIGVLRLFSTVKVIDTKKV